MPISYSDLSDAFFFVGAGGFGENRAFLDTQSGKIYWQSEHGGLEEELPEDIDDEKYLAIPDRRELGLGKPLVLEFARQILPDHYDDICRIFSRSGAYGRFKDFLERKRALDRWYEFSNAAEEAALREWCRENSIELID